MAKTVNMFWSVIEKKLFVLLSFFSDLLGKNLDLFLDLQLRTEKFLAIDKNDIQVRQLNSYLFFFVADKIIVGSYHGILRIYCPKPPNFKPDDLMLEVQLQQPILQVEAGRFVS